ncbi:MAG: hypothetical protein HY862_11755 [Chloroflexi bacterium]|nr:hypothetical protein [Chloroflexota bacterium]
MTTIHQNEEILKQLAELLEAHRPAMGRHTLTQVLMALGLTSEDWSAWYRLFSEERFNEKEVNGVLGGGDGTQMPCTSAHIEGVGYLLNVRTPPFQRGIHLAQRWFHGAF